MEFKQVQLDNGLEIVAEINQEAYSLAAGCFVRSGARDENDQIAGCSHFLEHMVFKGTPGRSAADVNLELDRMGGRANAYTSEEMTVFYGTVLPELRVPIVDLLADLMRPSLREDDFNMEKQVILEEISMYADQPPFGIDEKSRELFFGDHPLARSVLGSLDSIRELTSGQMKDYFHQRYSPENIIFAVTGKVDFDLLVQDIEQRCGKWEHYHAERKFSTAQAHRGLKILPRESAAQEYVFQMTSAPGTADFDRYHAALAAIIIGDDIGSRLFWDLIDNGKADTAALSYSDYSDAGTMTAVLCCAPEQTAENLKIMNDILLDAQQNGIEESELERAKNKILSRIVLGAERPIGRLFALGSEWLQKKEYLSIRDDIEKVRAITVDEVNAVLKKYPLDSPMTVATGPLLSLE